MYDSVGLKYDTRRQEIFQIYGEEDYIEVNEKKILRAVRNNRGGSDGCSANHEISVDSRLRCEKENTKATFKNNIFLHANNDKIAPEVTHLESG